MLLHSPHAIFHVSISKYDKSTMMMLVLVLDTGYNQVCQVLYRTWFDWVTWMDKDDDDDVDEEIESWIQFLFTWFDLMLSPAWHNIVRRDMMLSAIHAYDLWFPNRYYSVYYSTLCVCFLIYGGLIWCGWIWCYRCREKSIFSVFIYLQIITSFHMDSDQFEYMPNNVGIGDW